MKFLVVEDEPKIKLEVIDDVLASRRDIETCDWAKNQQEAVAFVEANDYDLVLMDLQIPSRPGGKPLPEFGKNTLRQIRDLKGQDVPVLLMTGYHLQCVDLMTDIQEIGINGSISKPFPPEGRTLNVVIDDVLAKFRRTRRAPAEKKRSLQPFSGGVLAFHPRHISLCGETIVEKNHRGYAWRILHLLREKNDRGAYLRYSADRLARKLHPNMGQNTASQAIKAVRERIAEILEERLGLNCGRGDVIDNGGMGYHLKNWIVVEIHERV